MAGANTLQFTDDNFDAEVLQSDLPVLVDFWADWCAPCRRLGPLIDELAEQYAGKVKVGKVDTNTCAKTAARFDINSIPTVIIFHEGQITDKIMGLRARREYEDALSRVVKK